MEVLLKKQVAIAKQVSQAIINFKKTGEARRTPNYLQSRITQAKDLFDRFSTNHQEIFSMDHDPSEDHEYIKDDLYAVTEETYFNYLSDLQTLLEKKQPDPEHTEVKTEVQLPRINLPKFDGSYSNWRAFHDLFTSLIHRDTRVPAVQKLHYLKASLCGEAERLIKKYTTIAANYQPAWELLERRYNNKRILVNNHLKESCNQLPIRVETAEGIKKLMDNTSERLNELEALGVSTQEWDTIIIHMMIQRLPAETHNLWEQKLGNTQELPTLPQFMDFLEARYRTLEAVIGTRSTKPLRSSSAPQL